MQAKARYGKLAGLQKLGRQNTSVGQWSSPGLNMSHGFMKKIQQMQMKQRRQLALKNAARANKELKAVSPPRSTKPMLQIYRPPGLPVVLLLTAPRLAEMECQQQPSPPSTDDVNRRPTNSNTSACGPVPDPKPGLNHCEVTLFPGRCASQSALRFTTRRAHSCARCCAVASAELPEVSRCDDGLWLRARSWRVMPERARNSKHVRDPLAAATPAHVARGHRAVVRVPM